MTELCDATGLHANTVREHLQRLIESGYVVPETEQRATRGRPRVFYSAATGADTASSPIATRTCCPVVQTPLARSRSAKPRMPRAAGI